MVTFPPLMPAASWFAIFFQSIAQGVSISDGIVGANEELASPRDFGRYSILDSKGERMTLSLAVEGGGRQLREIGKLTDIQLSEHGDWRRNHMKSLEACIGRKPYFPYLFPEMASIYLNKELKELKAFNTALFNFFYNFLVENIKESDFSRYYENEILIERGKEIARLINPEISAIEAIAELGKESLLGFLSAEW